MTPSDWLCTLAGVLLVLVALNDIAHTLLQPSLHGTLSSLVMRRLWAVWRWGSRGRPARLARAGPVLLLTVIWLWCTLVVVGWALPYLPHLPEGFVTTMDLTPAQRSGFWTALYFSGVSLSTVGFGDLAPASVTVRLLSVTESVVGFGLLTAGISWILAIFPPLTRHRTLAEEVRLLGRLEDELGRGVFDTDGAPALLASLVSRVVTAESDMVHFESAYYFAEREQRASLPSALPYLLALARRGSREGGSPAVRFQAHLLERALDDLALALRRHFARLPDGDTDAVFAAYAADHLRGPSAQQKGGAA